MRRILIFSCLSVFLVSSFAFSQNGKNIQILVKGKVTDEFTGNGVVVTMEFREPDGKKFRISTNSIDGSYQQIVDAGKKFDIVFTNFDIIRKTEPLQIENTTKYIEQIADFKVKRLVPGLKLLTYSAFDANSSAFKEEIQKSLEQLKEIMQFNRSVKFEFNINSHDTYKRIKNVQEIKPDKKKAKKGAKTESIITYSEPDASRIKSIVDSRVAEANKMLSSWTRFNDRITVSGDYSVGETDSENSNFIVIVKEIKNIFE